MSCRISLESLGQDEDVNAFDIVLGLMVLELEGILEICQILTYFDPL